MDGWNAFGASYRAHAPSVFRRARNMLGNDADAQDVVSDVFTSLYERPEQFSGRSSLSTFLYSMTTNACLNRLRSHRRRARLLLQEQPMISPSTPPLAPDRAVQLRALLAEMPEAFAQVAVYYYLDELTHDQIAEILDCSPRHVGNLLSRLTQWAQAQEQERSP